MIRRPANLEPEENSRFPTIPGMRIPNPQAGQDNRLRLRARLGRRPVNQLRRKEIFGIRDGARLRDGGVECTQEIRVRIDADQLRRFTERVEKGGDLRAAPRAGAVVIFPADDRAAQCALGRVVVERNARIIDKPRQAAPRTSARGAAPSR